MNEKEKKVLEEKLIIIEKIKRLTPEQLAEFNQRVYELLGVKPKSEA
ncbi:MAG: hypothetical protein IJC94_01520 [Oscillospiraceae bacterium]|nr:hypothetical protein [Oscillospiraceae bacterium]MBQ9938314.1 hypothetical protein [Oscillospiraceae bacterium]